MFDVFRMTRRPMCRWKSFWLGLLVLACQGWMWVRSMRESDQIGYTTGTWSWEFGSFDCGVGALWGEYTFSVGRFEFAFGVPTGGGPWFPAAVAFQQAGHLALGHLIVAWWLVMLVTAVGWVWFLTRRRGSAE